MVTVCTLKKLSVKIKLSWVKKETLNPDVICEGANRAAQKHQAPLRWQTLRRTSQREEGDALKERAEFNRSRSACARNQPLSSERQGNCSQTYRQRLHVKYVYDIQTQTPKHTEHIKCTTEVTCRIYSELVICSVISIHVVLQFKAAVGDFC